jgi:hypothetical protein
VLEQVTPPRRSRRREMEAARRVARATRVGVGAGRGSAEEHCGVGAVSAKIPRWGKERRRNELVP